MKATAERGAVHSGRGFTLVGRDRELQLLAAALAQPPAVVLIEGEAGVGKSRLVQEAALVLASNGMPVLTACCHPLREPLPFGPVLEALREAAQWLPATAALAPQAGVLASLLPELAEHLPAARAGASTERFQVFGAVRAVLGALGPVVLVVEDMHWVDEATRDLLLLLARDPPKELGLVLTYRREDLPMGAAVLGAPYRRPAGTGGAEIHLGPLRERDVGELARSVLGPRATPALNKTLFARSGGLPLVAEEDLLVLAAGLNERRTDVRRSAEADRRAPAGSAQDVAALAGAEVPRGLREAVGARLAALSDPAVKLVEAAAVLAVPATRPLLGAVAGLTSNPTAASLIEALNAGLLQEDSPTRYSFRHVLAQEAVYQAIPGPRREDLHARAVSLLREQAEPPLVQVAYHTRALGDMTAWLREAQAAAAQSLEVGDEGIAATLLRDILDQPRLDPDVRARTALTLARIAHVGVDYAASAAALRHILADPQLPAPTRGEIRLILGILMLNVPGDLAGLREVERSVDELRSRPELAARAMVNLALGGLGRQPAHELQAWIDRAERTLRDSSDEVARASVRHVRLTLLAERGDPTVWSLVDRLPRDTQNPAVQRQVSLVLFNVGQYAVDLGHDERAAELLGDSLALARHTGYPFVESVARTWLLRLDFEAGRWAGLEDRYVALGAEFPDLAYVAADAAYLGGRLAAARGQWTRSLSLLRKAAQVWEKGGSIQLAETLQTAAEIARVHLAQDDPSAAFATLAPHFEALRRAELWPRAGDLISVAVLAALAGGRDEIPGELIDQAEQGLQGADAPAAAADLSLARGILLHHQDRSPEAADLFDHALLMFQAIGRPYSAARTIEHTAATHVKQPVLAVEELGRATAIYADLGATADAARCHKSLRELGLSHSSPQRRRDYGSQLSPRESEVALLLADGASNKDIAHALSLSPRTVEHHVANLLKKRRVTREELRGGNAGRSPEA